MLLVALAFLAFLSILGGALLSSATLDVAVGDAYEMDVQALGLAEGGIEEARENLRALVAGVPSPSTTTPLVAGPDYEVFLVRDANGVLTLRSTAKVRKAARTIEAVVLKSGFPMLPSPVTLQGDPGLDPRFSSPAGIDRLFNEVASNATDVYGAASLNNVGSATNYRIVLVNGDCQFGPGTGYGILAVRGNLYITGNFAWNGLILVVGQGALTIDPAANGQVSGGVFVARTVDNSPVVLNYNASAVAFKLDAVQIAAAHAAYPYTRAAVREY